MSVSTPFIRRPVGTTLLTLAILLAGLLGYFMLPVSPLPQVDFPTIMVFAQLPGASPETMASAVAAPLERQFSRIAGVTEMTSTSFLGSTNITLQFDLDRDTDGAARDVQAAINAASGQLPADLPNQPQYRKANPSDSPIMILAMTSDIHTMSRMYDVAATLVQQQIAQVSGVGQVNVGGGSTPAVRVDVNPTVLSHYDLGLDDVRRTLSDANANRPKGNISGAGYTWSISTTDQLMRAEEYRPLIVAFRDGAPIRLQDVAEVTDSVEDIRATGLLNGKRSITLIVFRQPSANIVATVDRVRGILPAIQAQIPAGMTLYLVADRTTTIRSSIAHVQLALLISFCLVVLVVFIFLRDLRATTIPSVAVPVSLIGTCGVMYLLGYSLNNLSLMAMTVATGFVVDDAIVVLENIARHLEAGMPARRAALRGAREISFTVVSISVSLVAVFIPILLMGGVVGRLFREFAVTLSVAILVSMVVSLTTTPMMCAIFLKSSTERRHGVLYRASERALDWVLRTYEWTLRGVLRHERFTLAVMLATIAGTVYLYVIIPKGFFPQQDTGRLMGGIQADQGTSFQAMSELLVRFANVVRDDPAIESVNAFTGGSFGGSGNTARMFAALKPLEERKISADEVIARIRAKTSKMPGATLILQSVQDVRIGGRSSSAQYQYSLRGNDLEELNWWAPRVADAMKQIPGIVDVNTDQQNRGLQVALEIDRKTAAQLGVTPQQIDNALYDAFGQRPVSTMYKLQNQYRVVMGVAPEFWQDPEALRHLHVRGRDDAIIPLSTICRFERKNTALSVSHAGQFPSVTISFGLEPGVSLGDAVARIEDMSTQISLPENVHGRFAGSAQAFQDSLANQPLLILAAIVAVYITLGILYESYIHPITILSTLPAAGLGALLTLMLCNAELTVIALIGIVLLIGIVKKNAIMMVDFALDAERRLGLTPDEAIFQACILRFRPITMTTMAAMFGALPLALGAGDGAELRRPLGIAIVGGLIFSQVFSLYTTPVVYLYLDRLRLWWKSSKHDVPMPEIAEPVHAY